MILISFNRNYGTMHWCTRSRDGNWILCWMMSTIYWNQMLSKAFLKWNAINLNKISVRLMKLWLFKHIMYPLYVFPHFIKKNVKLSRKNHIKSKYSYFFLHSLDTLLEHEDNFLARNLHRNSTYLHFLNKK